MKGCTLAEHLSLLPPGYPVAQCPNCKRVTWDPADIGTTCEWGRLGAGPCDGRMRERPTESPDEARRLSEQWDSMPPGPERNAIGHRLQVWVETNGSIKPRN